jgi:uncharacterized protein (DUF2062 family)
MRKHFRKSLFFRHIPTQASIRKYRFLKPWYRYLDHHYLWQFNRHAIAGGLAVGLFFSVATPVAQIPAATIFAILCRVNLPVAIFGTLFSNPFTTPAILYCAYKLGAFLIGHEVSDQVAIQETDTLAPERGHILDSIEWLMHSIDWLQSAGLPLAVGLAVLSVLLAITGYFGVMAIWRLQVGLHWRARGQDRKNRAGGTETDA